MAPTELHENWIWGGAIQDSALEPQLCALVGQSHCSSQDRRYTDNLLACVRSVTGWGRDREAWGNPLSRCNICRCTEEPRQGVVQTRPGYNSCQDMYCSGLRADQAEPVHSTHCQMREPELSVGQAGLGCNTSQFMLRLGQGTGFAGLGYSAYYHELELGAGWAK